jgi:hypothetical protein
MKRRDFLTTAAKAGLVGATVSGAGLSLVGCGGGGSGDSDRVTIRTSGNGSLSDVILTPEAGATFISRSEDLEIEWPNGNPPDEFTVRLQRFREPRGGESREISSQKITVDDLGGNRWRIRRRDNFDLDARGVYYLEFTSPGQSTERFAFIVDPSRSVTINPGTNGFLEDVIVSPRPGSVFVSRSQVFQLRWTGAFPPPSTFTVFLRRYKEPRGDDDGSDTEQQITLTDRFNGTDFVWDLVRRDNFLLESDATYYIQINSGPNTVRYTFITES